MLSTLKIGTRASPLALVQAQQVIDALVRTGTYRREQLTLVPLSTKGDRFPHARISDIGGKGVFSKALDIALVQGHIDIAVHALKDVEVDLPYGVCIGAVLKREDPRDALITFSGDTLTQLGPSPTIGTSSQRRCLMVQAMRPDSVVIPMRGNLATRIAKLRGGCCDAIILAYCGLLRLDIAQHASEVFSVDDFLPSAGQGAISIHVHERRHDLYPALAYINDAETRRCVEAERSLLFHLDGSCRTPIGAYATVTANGQLRLRGVLGEDVSWRSVSGEVYGDDPLCMGEQLAKELRAALNT